MTLFFISESKEIADDIINDLKYTFIKHNLKITLSIMSTDYKTIPFLDVKHVLNVDSEIKSIKIKSFKKETAIKLTFLNNRSYNPQNIFKGTEKSETSLNIK